MDTLTALKADLIVGLTHQTVEADRDLLAREPRIDLILGGHEHEAHDSVVSGRHVLKADANSRSAQFATLWGGKGKWRQAVGLRHHRLPAPGRHRHRPRRRGVGRQPAQAARTRALRRHGGGADRRAGRGVPPPRVRRSAPW